MKTDVSKKAREIYEEILPSLLDGTDFRLTFEIGEDVFRVQTRFRQVLNENGWKGVVQGSISGSRLYVCRRRSRSDEKLRQMVRKLAQHVDDEKLYEQAVALAGAI